MGIIIGIIQSIFSSLGMVVSKKVVENKAVGNNLQTLFSRTAHVVLLTFIVFFGVLDFQLPLENITYLDWGMFILASAALYVTYFLRRTAYANEKVSTLQPFAMLFQVFPIIFGFIFIATERANVITFLMAITASLIVIIPSVDFKNLKISKYSLMVLASSTIKSVQLFVVIYLLTKLNPVSLYITESFIIIALAVIMMLSKSEFSEFKKLTKKYTCLLVTANTVGVIGIILSLTMYSSLGVVATSLISLLYLVFVYIFGFLILKEIPAKKDILIAAAVAICIIIGMMFKVS